jgi:hypothetical protein
LKSSQPQLERVRDYLSTSTIGYYRAVFALPGRAKTTRHVSAATQGEH